MPASFSKASMRFTPKTAVLLSSALLLGAALYTRRSIVAAQRRKQIARGELCNLSETWGTVDSCEAYVRLHVGGVPHERLPVILATSR
jgi:hypothetical protein